MAIIVFAEAKINFSGGQIQLDKAMCIARVNAVSLHMTRAPHVPSSIGVTKPPLTASSITLRCTGPEF
jgi:hypothetical protein